MVSAALPHYAFELAGVIGLLTGLWLAVIWRRPLPSGDAAAVTPAAPPAPVTRGSRSDRRRAP